jgi:hypothetical protein
MPTNKRPPPTRPEAPVQVKAAPPGTIPEHILAAANLWNRSTPNAKAKASPPPLRLPPPSGASLRSLELATATSSQGSLRSEPARPLTPTTHGLLGPPIRQPSSDPARGSRLSEPGDSQPDLNLPSGSGIQRDELILRIEAAEGIYDPVLGYTPGQYPRQTPEGSLGQTPEGSPRISTDPPLATGSASNEADAVFAGLIVGDSEQWGCETFLGLKPEQEALHEKWQKTIKSLPRREPQGNATTLSRMAR